MLKKICVFMLIVLCAFPVTTVMAKNNPVKLNIDEVIQEKTNWCWAASAQCVSDYLGGDGLSQSKIVKNVKGKNVNEGANAKEQKQALNVDGIDTNYTSSNISFSKIKKMIGEWSSPILVHIEWSSGGAHAVVIYGYYDDSKAISYMDPWGDNSRWNFSSYSNFKSNDDFTWIRTYYENAVS